MLSRINWFPVPAMLVVALYLLETPQSKRSLWDYLKWPVAWCCISLATVGASWWGYHAAIGIKEVFYQSSLSSLLLWYRLWPNATFATGIVPGILILTVPVLTLTVYAFYRKRLAFIRWCPIVLILIVLLVGGAVVSSKVGGGNNLHNLDAYLVLTMLLAGYSLSDKLAAEERNVSFRPSGWVWLALIIPVVWCLPEIHYASPRNAQQSQAELQTIQQEAQKAAKNGGEVLFIWQRHLLALKMVPGVPVVTDYELELLMEMSMSNNQTYLQHFYQDLQSHRFALIIADQQRTELKDQTQPFWEENNIWVERVSIPMLESYKSQKVLPQSGVEILEPR
jgi:hypothetical protein